MEVSLTSGFMSSYLYCCWEAAVLDLLVVIMSPACCMGSQTLNDDDYKISDYENYKTII